MLNDMLVTLLSPGDTVHEGIKQCLDVSLVDGLLLQLEPGNDCRHQLRQVTARRALHSSNANNTQCFT